MIEAPRNVPSIPPCSLNVNGNKFDTLKFMSPSTIIKHRVISLRIEHTILKMFDSYMP